MSLAQSCHFYQVLSHLYAPLPASISPMQSQPLTFQCSRDLLQCKTSPPCLWHCSHVHRYKTQSHVARRDRAETFFLLMDLMQFFDLYHEGKLDVAFDVSL